MAGTAMLIPLKQQAMFGPTEQWTGEARAILQTLKDRQALLRPVCEVVPHAASGRSEGS